MGVRRILFLNPARTTGGTSLFMVMKRQGFDCDQIEANESGDGLPDNWLTRFRPDALVANGFREIVPEAFDQARRFGAATILVLHDGSLRNTGFLDACDRVVVYSRFLADYYRDSLGIACDVLPIPIATRMKAGVGEEGRRRHVTFVDPTPAAGVFAFTRIADEMGRRRPDIPILVVEGRGTEADLASCGIDLRPRGNVHLMGRPDLPEAYWEVTRIAVIPSVKWDACGMEAAEALARGVQVVASDRGALPEVLAGTGTVLPLPGWLTPATQAIPSAEEVAPWVEAIIRLWDDPPVPVPGAIHGQFAEMHVHFFRSIRAGTPVPRSQDTSRSRWVVLVPFLNSIEHDCEFGLRRLEEAGVRVVRCRGSSAIDMARNRLASEALRYGCESILFIDADIGFDPADALHLLARPEPVVAGVYPKKGLCELACAFAPGVDHVTFGPDAAGLYPLDHTAAGFLRIRSATLRAMIEALRLPLCNRNEGGGVWPFFLPMIVPGDEPRYLGEDFAFSHRLRQIGVTPMADTSFRLFHIGPHGYSWEEAGSPTTRYRGHTIRIVNRGPSTDPDSGIKVSPNSL